MRPTRFLFSLLGVSLCFTPPALAQVPDPAVASASPIPGAGHHYIGLATETVNPADGLISYELPISVPAGRQLSLPFGFRYASSEQFYLTEYSFSSTLNWLPRLNTGGEIGGWSYDLPGLTFGNQVLSFWTTYTGPPPQGAVDHQCDASMNYVFRGLDGAQYALGLGFHWVDQNYTNTNPATTCYGNDMGSSSAHGITATTPSTWSNWPTHPPVTVSDHSGTIYQFGSQLMYTFGSSMQEPVYWLLPSTITERNGNQITQTANGFKDTLGRTVVSWTGLGNDGDHVSVSGLSSNFVLHWTSVPVTFPGTLHNVSVSDPNQGTRVNCSMGTSSAGSIRVVSEIDLPNGQKYTFSYDPNYGRVSKVTFPGGGYARYVWGLNTSSTAALFTNFMYPLGNNNYCNIQYDTPAVTDRYLSYDGSTEVLHQHFAYTTNWNTSSPWIWISKSTTVTTTDLLTNQVAVTIYNYAPIATDMGGPYSAGGGNVPPTVPVESSVVYQDGSGHTLKTVNKTWLDVFSMVGEQTVLDNGQGMTSLRCYDANEQTTDLYEYGFQSEGAKPADPSCASSSGLTTSGIGPLRRHTVTAYHNFLGGTPSTHILNEPNSITVYDGFNNQVSQTSVTYDANSVVASGAATGLVAPPGLRGNVSTVAHWLNTGGSSPVTSYTYFDTGQIQSMTDACGNTACADMTGSNHTTMYSYADNFTSGTGTPPGQTNAYLTQVTHPNTGVAHIEKLAWGYNDGLVRSTIDQNNQITNYKYNTPPTGCSLPDGLDRLSEIDYPDTGKTTFCYNDSPYNSSTPSPNVTTTRATTSTANVTSLAAFDGLGHTVRSVLTSDPDCATGDRTDTTYDGFGRLYTTSNPYCSTSDSTYGLTTYAYDTLGRTTQVTHPDNSTVLTNYIGRATQVQDEGNGTQRVARISQSDGLGRLISLCEVASGPFVVPSGNSTASLIGSAGTPAACGQDIPGTGFLTTYQYDTLSNLLQVNQAGIAPRTFTYDSLSRLLTASNPESGAISYAYDANGNLSAKTSPLPNQTGTATVTTTYQYDAINRLTQKSYNDGATPPTTYSFDAPCGSPNLNTVGRLAYAVVPGWSFCYSYDLMGHLVDKDLRSPQNQIYYLDYTYDLLGDITSQTAGYGAAYYAYNTAGRPITVTSSYSDPNNPATVFSGAHYNAFGGLTSDTLGNNETETYSYVPKLTRLQSYTAKLNTTTNYNFNITSFAPNGDILAATDTANGNWTYTYDPFNRLVGANKNSGQTVYNYVYDRFGNRWQQYGGTNSFIATFTGNNQNTPANNNRVDGYSHDAAGNLLNDGSHQYTYDAENRLIKVDNGATATYTYDADGNRVQKVSATGNGGDPAGTWQFLYDQSGRMVQRDNGTFWQGNIFVGGRHLVEDGGGTNFSHSDWLGTERVRTTNTGAVCESIASLPFGDGQTTTGNCYHDSSLHFTGKQRDSESGLDYFGARYNASSMGRFLSPDAFFKDSHVGNPQSWNEYAYARNNPLRYVDPTGEKATVSTTCTNDNQTGHSQTCTVTVTASIVIYATSGSGLTQGQLDEAASTIKSNIETAWAGSFTGQDQNGNSVTYNVSTQVNVQVAASQDAAMQSGAQNVIGLSNGNGSSSASSFVDSSIRHGGVGPDTGIWNYQSLSDARHEFAHLVGGQDRDSGFSIMNHLLPTGGLFATSADLQELLGGAVTHWTGNWDTAAADTGGIVQRGGRPTMAPGSPPQTVNGVFVNTHIPWRHWWR
jgi:RHS repeat-associated protein